MTQRDYEGEGRRAFERGEKASKNPYRFGTPHYSWANGWVEAWWASPAGRAETERLNAMDRPAAQPSADQGSK